MLPSRGLATGCHALIFGFTLLVVSTVDASVCSSLTSNKVCKHFCSMYNSLVLSDSPMVVAESGAAHLQRVVCPPCSSSMRANLDLFGTHLALSLYNRPISSLMANPLLSFHSICCHSCLYLLAHLLSYRLKDIVSPSRSCKAHDCDPPI